MPAAACLTYKAGFRVAACSVFLWRRCRRQLFWRCRAALCLSLSIRHCKWGAALELRKPVLIARPDVMHLRVYFLAATFDREY